MIDTRFLGVARINLVYEMKGRPERLLRGLPHATMEIDEVIRMLNAIEAAHDDDVAANADWLMAPPPGDPDRERTFRTREMSRIGAYVVFATTLDGVVRGSYDSLFKYMEACDEALWRATTARHEPLLAARGSEIAEVVLVRNKVFAHTAWSHPILKGPAHKRDSLSRQSTSLAYLAGNGTSYEADGLIVGVMTVGPEGDRSGTLPVLGIRRMSETVAAHLREWRGMAEDAVRALRSIPDAKIMRAISGVVEVHRYQYER